jgi:hypothetical protein
MPPGATDAAARVLQVSKPASNHVKVPVSLSSKYAPQVKTSLVFAFPEFSCFSNNLPLREFVPLVTFEYALLRSYHHVVAACGSFSSKISRSGSQMFVSAVGHHVGSYDCVISKFV